MLVRGVPVDRYGKARSSSIYWGVGMHLGNPWPQNAKGHLLGDVTDQRVVLRDGCRHSHHVGFLKRIASEHGARHLAGDRQDWRPIHVRGRESCDEICRSRAGRCHTHAHAIARARIAIRGVRGGLLVAHEDVPERRMPMQRVVERHDRPARVAE